MGALGQKKRTNAIVRDEDGNIISNVTTWNTTESVASTLAKAAGRNALKGLAGSSATLTKTVGAKSIGKNAAKAVTQTVTPGVLNKVRAV